MTVPPRERTVVADELATLVETLHRTGQRLEELTSGEVDAVADRHGRTFLLQHAQEHLRLTDATRQAAILNALPAHIAMIDHDGQVTSVNEAWRQFGESNGLHSPGAALGTSYLRICDRAQGAGAADARQVAAGIRSVLANQCESFSMEYSCDSPSEARWFLMTVTPLVVAHSVGAVVMHVNITQRKRAEKRVESALARLTEAQRIGRMGDWEYDIASQAIGWSPEVFKIFGRDPLLGVPRSYAENGELFQLASRVLQDEKLALAIATGETQEYELVARRPDGEEIHIHGIAMPEADSTGTVRRLYGTVQDISARKRAESAVVQSESRYRSLFENMLEGYAYCRTIFEQGELVDFVYISVNAAFARLTGLHDVVGRKASEVIPGLRADLPGLFELYGRVALTGVPERTEVCVGALGIWLSIAAYSDDPGAFVAVFDNISERKQAQQALQAGEHEQRQLAQQLEIERSRLVAAQQVAKIGSWETDLATRAVVWSDETHRIHGTDPATFQPTHDAFLQIVHPDDRARVDQAFIGSIRQRSACSIEHRLLLADGTVKFVEERWRIFLDAQALPLSALGTVQDITGRRQAEIRLRDSESRFRQMAESIDDVFFLREADGSRMLYLSPAYESIWGRSRGSVYADQEAWADAIHPDDRDLAVSKYREALSGKLDYQYRIVRPDGSIRWIETRSFPVRDASGGIVRVAGVAKDITERKRTDARISYLTRVYSMLSGINSLIARVRDRAALFDGACRIAVEEGGFRMALICLVDRASGKLVPSACGGMPAQFRSAITALLASEDAANAVVTRAIETNQTLVSNNSESDPNVLLGKMHADAGIRSIAVFPLLVADKAVAALTLYACELEFFHEDELKLLAGLAGDIAFAIDHIEKAERLNYLAYYDALTGLANRSLFLERVAQSVRSGEATGATLSMVLVDIERFKHINDRLGRSGGDALLACVGERLTRALGDASLVARVGADQFALLLTPHRREGDVVRFVDRISNALEESFCIGDVTVRVAARFGVARFPDDGRDAEVLFRNVEIALKLAKSSGERFAYYSREMNARNTQRLALEEQLRAAVDARQFVLHYQPCVDMISGEIVSAEALIRWQHPEKGLVAPGEFIALAEESGLIDAIGKWVIDSVCAQQASWKNAGIAIVPIAVNVSSVQFSNGHLHGTISAALAANSLSASCLGLELTESAVMKDSTIALKTLQGLRALGIGLALDDFGTGYSSLAHLKRFPFSTVKIDRSFVTDITRKPEDAAIAAAIIAMGHGLNLTVIAEGVETEGQFHFLQSLGCDEFQGYFFSPAVGAEQFESLLRSGARLTQPVRALADQRTLLVVDDEPNICSAITRVVRRDGYRILTASSGQEGLDLLALNSVEVIISDQRMPGMSGTEFLNAVKQLYPKTVRIILSGYTDLKVVTDSVNRGAVFRFLTKPWDDQQLREQVRDAFRRSRP